jgi:hypothetical protein
LTAGLRAGFWGGGFLTTRLTLPFLTVGLRVGFFTGFLATTFFCGLATFLTGAFFTAILSYISQIEKMIS